MSIQDHRAFGEALRRARKEGGFTIKQVATQLGFTVGYVSDIERGKRNPLEPEQIDRVCELLGRVWLTPLYEASVVSRGAMTVRLNETRGTQLELAAALMRRWSHLSDDQLGQIQSIISPEQ